MHNDLGAVRQWQCVWSRRGDDRPTVEKKASCDLTCLRGSPLNHKPLLTFIFS